MQFDFQKIRQIWGVRYVIVLLKKVVIPGLKGFSLYDLMDMYIRGLIKGAITIRASAISYSLFMAFFPFLLFLMNLIPFIPVEGFQEAFLSFLYELLPPKTLTFFDAIISDIVNKQRVGLLSSTFMLSLLFMSNGINAVFEGFSNSYHTKITRGVVQQYGVSIVVAVIVALFLFINVYVNLYFVFLVETYREYVIGDFFYWLKIGRFVLFFLMIYVTMAILFYFGTKDRKGQSFFSVGSLLTTVLVIVTTYLFAFYINNFSQYNELYGSIGALLIFMIYIWINSNLVLLGYELDASLRRLK